MLPCQNQNMVKYKHTNIQPRICRLWQLLSLTGHRPISTAVQGSCWFQATSNV